MVRVETSRNASTINIIIIMTHTAKIIIIIKRIIKITIRRRIIITSITIKKKEKIDTQLKTNRKLKLLDYYNKYIKQPVPLFIVIAVSNIFKFHLIVYTP